MICSNAAVGKILSCKPCPRRDRGTKLLSRLVMLASRPGSASVWRGVHRRRLPHSLGRLLIRWKEQLDRQLRQRYIDRRAENAGRAHESQRSEPGLDLQRNKHLVLKPGLRRMRLRMRIGKDFI